MARDLHDGLAQELAYISRNLDAPGESSMNATRRLHQAVERAQFELRSAISALASPGGQAVGDGAGTGGIADRGTVPHRPRPRHRAGRPALTHAGRGTGAG